MKELAYSIKNKGGFEEIWRRLLENWKFLYLNLWCNGRDRFFDQCFLNVISTFFTKLGSFSNMYMFKYSELSLIVKAAQIFLRVKIRSGWCASN